MMLNNNPLPELIRQWYPELRYYSRTNNGCEIKSPLPPTTKKHLDRRLRSLGIPKDKFLIVATDTSRYLSFGVAHAYLLTIKCYLENL